MDIVNFGANYSMVREHLTLFALLLLALPLTSFIGVKFWIAARASKVQRTTQWFVPDDLKSEAARVHYGMGRQSVALSQQRRCNSSGARRNPR